MSSSFLKLGFRFHRHLHFNSRHFCNSSNLKVIHIDGPHKFIEYVREQYKLGFNNLEFPLNLYKQMMSLVRRPSIFDFNRLLAAVLRLKGLDPHPIVISHFRYLELSGTRLDSYSIGILTNCYCHVGRVDFGFSLLAKSLKLGYQFESNLVLFTTLINGLVQNGRLPDAVKFFDVAVFKLGVRPDIVTFGKMFKGLCTIGDNISALHLLRKMRSAPSCCKPDIVIYNTVIDRLCQDELISEALKLFSVMKTEGIKPDVYTYTSLIRRMFNLGRKGKAKEMLVEMMESNIEPDVNTYSMLVDMYCKDMMTDEAETILSIMIKRGLNPNVVTYSALMDGYCLCGQMDKARDLVDLMVKNHCQPNVVTFSTLIKGFVKLQRLDKAIEILKEMSEHGIDPDVVLYNILIDGLYKAGHVQDAETFASDLLSRGLVPSLRTYSYHVLSKANVKSHIGFLSPEQNEAKRMDS